MGGQRPKNRIYMSEQMSSKTKNHIKNYSRLIAKCNQDMTGVG